MTEVLDPPLTSPVQVALDDVNAALDQLHDIDLWSLGSDELIRVTAEMQLLRTRAESMTVKLVHEVDARGAAVARGAASTASWLRWAHRMHPGAAKRMVDTAGRCTPTRPGHSSRPKQ